MNHHELVSSVPAIDEVLARIPFTVSETSLAPIRREMEKALKDGFEHFKFDTLEADPGTRGIDDGEMEVPTNEKVMGVVSEGYGGLNPATKFITIIAVRPAMEEGKEYGGEAQS